jgi:hypothetical protein
MSPLLADDNSPLPIPLVIFGELPLEADLETAKSKCNNDILEIMFDKKKETKPNGKEIKVE